MILCIFSIHKSIGKYETWSMTLRALHDIPKGELCVSHGLHGLRRCHRYSLDLRKSNIWGLQSKIAHSLLSGNNMLVLELIS